MSLALMMTTAHANDAAVYVSANIGLLAPTTSSDIGVSVDNTTSYGVMLGYVDTENSYRTYIGGDYNQWDNGKLVDAFVGVDYFFYENPYAYTYVGLELGYSKLQEELFSQDQSGFTPGVKLGFLVFDIPYIDVDVGYKYKLLNFDANSNISVSHTSLLYFGVIYNF